MTKFVIRRLVWTIPVMLVVILFTFFLMRQIKGNPFRKSERAIPASIQANLERKFGLDKPWYVQYWRYVKGFATFDLGPSIVLRNQNVNDIVRAHFPVSTELGGYASIFAVAGRHPAGGDLGAQGELGLGLRGAARLGNVGFAVPSFLVATLLIYFFAFKWRRLTGLPVSGWDSWQSKVLPSIALGFLPMAYFARLVRGTMLETLQQDYVRTAKAKGLRWRRVVRPARAAQLADPGRDRRRAAARRIITGSFIIENIFAIPGIGRYYVTAVTGPDYSVVMGLTVLLSVIVIVGNLLVDLLYGVLDPRTREARDGERHRWPHERRRPAGRAHTTVDEQRGGRRAGGRGRRRSAQTSLWRDALPPLPSPTGGAVVAAIVFLAMLAYVVVVPCVSPYDPYEVDFSQAYLSRPGRTRSAPTSSAATC